MPGTGPSVEADTRHPLSMAARTGPAVRPNPSATPPQVYRRKVVSRAGPKVGRAGAARATPTGASDRLNNQADASTPCTCSRTRTVRPASRIPNVPPPVRESLGMEIRWRNGDLCPSVPGPWNFGT